jgi:hypothetical protein
MTEAGRDFSHPNSAYATMLHAIEVHKKEIMQWSDSFFPRDWWVETEVVPYGSSLKRARASRDTGSPPIYYLRGTNLEMEVNEGTFLIAAIYEMGAHRGQMECRFVLISDYVSNHLSERPPWD